MDLPIHLEEQGGRVIATTPGVPGCHGIGPDRDAAVARLERAVRAYVERAPPSPFATVRRRLSEPGRGPVSESGDDGVAGWECEPHGAAAGI